MSRSGIYSFAYLPGPTLSLDWRIGTAIASLAAIAISIVAVAPSLASFGEGALVSAALILVFLLILHTRFLCFALFQNRQKAELVRTREHEFRSLFEKTSDAILVVDHKGVCQDANPSATNLFSMRGDKIIGQPIHAFYVDRNAFNSMWTQFREDPQFEGKAELVRADGATVFAEFIACADFLPNRHLMIIRDISSHRRAQQMVKQSLTVARSSWQEAETLRKASLALTEDLRMNSVLDALLRTLADFVPYERAQLYLLESDTEFFLAHEATQRTEPIREKGLPETFNASDIPIVGRVLESQQGILLENLTDGIGWERAGLGCSVRSWMGIPILASDVLLGLLSVSDSHPGQFSVNHLALARSLALPAAVAIQNARLYERAEIYGAELERRVTELRKIEQALKDPGNKDQTHSGSFECIFQSAPVAISVSSLSEGRYFEINEAFERLVGLSREELMRGHVREVELWEDPRERSKLIERLSRGVRVRNAVARLRLNANSYREMMYSAEVIEFEGERCLLLATDDSTELNRRI